MTTSLWRIAAATILILGTAGACRRAADGIEAETARSAAESIPAGTVVLTPGAMAGGGIAVETARMANLDVRIRALGEIEFDARHLASVPARATGRLERVAAFLGDQTRAGQTLAEIYSQDFLALQAEVLQAAGRAERLRGGQDETGAATFLAAARKKLVPLGLSESEIDTLIGQKAVFPLLPVRAPFAGVVIESNAMAGGQVEPGTCLFKIADPSLLWGCVHIFEKDLAAVRPGLEAVLRTQAYPGEEFRGRLVLVGETMDSKTRTVEGRIEVPNPKRRLKPGMYVEASLAASGKRRALVVPEAAVQEFRGGTVVFVQTAPTTFVLRPVETGEHLGGIVEIARGLGENEKVVTAGSFLIKSEMLKKSLGD